MSDAPPDIDDLAGRLRLAVVRLSRRLRQEDVVATGITMSQLSALAVIGHNGEMTLGEVAEAERVQPPTMTRIVGRLEELGLLERRESPGDRRVSLVRATEKGHVLLAESRARRTAFLAKHLEQFADDEIALLVAALPLFERLIDE